MHIDGVLKRRDSFEHIDPKLVGNRRRLLITRYLRVGAARS